MGANESTCAGGDVLTRPSTQKGLQPIMDGAVSQTHEATAEQSGGGSGSSGTAATARRGTGASVRRGHGSTSSLQPPANSALKPGAAASSRTSGSGRSSATISEENASSVRSERRALPVDVRSTSIWDATRSLGREKHVLVDQLAHLTSEEGGTGGSGAGSGGAGGSGAGSGGTSERGGSTLTDDTACVNRTGSTCATAPLPQGATLPQRAQAVSSELNQRKDARAPAETAARAAAAGGVAPGASAERASPEGGLPENAGGQPELKVEMLDEMLPTAQPEGGDLSKGGLSKGGEPGAPVESQSASRAAAIPPPTKPPIAAPAKRTRTESAAATDVADTPAANRSSSSASTDGAKGPARSASVERPDPPLGADASAPPAKKHKMPQAVSPLDIQPMHHRGGGARRR